MAHNAENIIYMLFYRKCMLILGLDKWLAAWAVHSDRLGFKSLLLLINWVNHLISLSKKKKI